MALQDQIDTDLATSMKEGVVSRTAVLRLIKSSLKNEQIKLGHELDEAEALKVLQREAKQRKDSIEQYQQGGRADLADSERAELAIIDTYLPDQMSPDELSQLVDAVIQETDATATQMGVVIGAVLQRAGGRADGTAVSQAVRQKLA
jgi:uncharacterized protein YqeY